MAEKENHESTMHSGAEALLRGSQFLLQVSRLLSSLGLVGEQRNRLIIVLAGLTATADPVSIMVKGPSSSGKSNLVRTALAVFPETTVIELSSLSPKAPVHGKDDYNGKILFLTEQRGGRDAQYFLRQLQSEGKVSHEATTVEGQRRSHRSRGEVAALS